MHVDGCVSSAFIGHLVFLRALSRPVSPYLHNARSSKNYSLDHALLFVIRNFRNLYDNCFQEDSVENSFAKYTQVGYTTTS